MSGKWKLGFKFLYLVLNFINMALIVYAVIQLGINGKMGVMRLCFLFMFLSTVAAAVNDGLPKDEDED